MVKVYLAGRLTADPETRDYNGKMITNVNVAANAGYDKDKKPVTNFYRASFFGEKGDPISKYFKKGDQIILGGDLKITTYTGTDGKEREQHQIEYATWEFGAKAKANQADEPVPVSTPEEPGMTVVENPDDDLPF